MNDDLIRIVQPLASSTVASEGQVLQQQPQNQAPVLTVEGVSTTQTGEMTDEEIYHRRIGVIEADLESNCKQHGIRGILEHKDIMAMIAEYSEEDKQARVYGKFQHLTGLVYKKFTRKIHVIRPFLPRPAEYCVVELLDPHPRLPDAVMWVAFDPKGRKFVVDELYENFGSIEEMAYKIKQRGNQYRIVQRRADPIAWNADQHDPTRKTLARALDELGLTYIPASKDRAMGIQLVHNALDYQVVRIGDGEEMVKAPMLYVFETCQRTTWEFEHWQYYEWTGKTAERRNPSEKPQDKDDHMMENLGRALLDEIRFVPMPQQGTTLNVGSIPTLDPYR